MHELLTNLNAEQILPVTTTEGAVLVFAGAGSGKTRVLTTRITYLMQEKNILPNHILAITFTNKAAREMQERLQMLCNIDGMWCCTIHSMCVRILRQFGDRLGYSSSFSIYGDAERDSILKRLFKEQDIEEEKDIRHIKNNILKAKTLGLSPQQYLEANSTIEKIDIVTQIYKQYIQVLKDNNAIDFDGLLMETLTLLKTNAEVLYHYAQKFQYIHVDEFQDTNAVQFEIILLLASHWGNVFVVGDDDQSIYGWRGAQIDNILKFDSYFPNAQRFKLERNYRSTKHIIALANAVIQNNHYRQEKALWTEAEEGEHANAIAVEREQEEAFLVARQISSYIANGGAYGDIAVLMRINAISRSFEQEFMKYGIPFKIYGGFRFYERKEIKDILAYLRIINNPNDGEAILRIINLPKRGIGLKTVETLLRYARSYSISLYDAILNSKNAGISGATLKKLEEFERLLVYLIACGKKCNLVELLEQVLKSTNILQLYSDKKDEESVAKMANIHEFINAVEEYANLNAKATLADFLNEVTLSSDLDEESNKNNGQTVTLATIHAVKGLEFPVVFLVGMEDGILPLSRAQDNVKELEEERRLLYVAITRAKKKIYFTRAKNRFMYGMQKESISSRFMKELASELDLSNFLSKSVLNAYYERHSYDRSPSYDSPKSFYREEERSIATKEFAFSAAANFKRGMQENTNTTIGKDYGQYTVGRKVLHTKFGKGTIISTEGSGKNLIATIAFEGFGMKQLSVQIAPLQLL